MPEEPSPPLAAEMAHVLTMDLVGYSLLPMSHQRQLVNKLQEFVRNTKEFCRAHTQEQLISLPTGDGMAIVFFGDPEAPVRCALELSGTLCQHNDIQLRMGMHTGPVYRVADINLNSNVAGGGINIAQRVMDCGEQGHILLSSMIADVLIPFATWSNCLHDLGEVEVKHGLKVHIYNLYNHGFGNPAVPQKLRMDSDTLRLTSPVAAPAGVGSLVGQTVSHYRVLKRLGAGGMGVVYEAEDLRLGRRVAVKSLLEEHPQNLQESGRLLQEARAASSLNHPNICTVFDVGDFNGGYFIVMELLEGETLKSRLQRESVSMQSIAELGIQIADALDCAHSHRIIHRDIKPANIFLTSRGQAKVLDFGVAKLIADKREGTTSDHEGSNSPASAHTVSKSVSLLVGTVPYMSPEQLLGCELDARSDLFSLGVVLYEMATGTLPFRGTSSEIARAILDEAPIPPARLNPGVPVEIDNVISKSLAKDPRFRYQSAVEVRGDLALFVKQTRGASATVQSHAELAIRDVALLYKRNAEPDNQVLGLLEQSLREAGCKVFVDRHLTVGMEWAREIERRVSTADAVVVLLSESSVHSEMLAYEIQIAHEAADKREGRPWILPIRLKFDGALPGVMGSILDGIQYAMWKGPQDNGALVSEILASLQSPQKQPSKPVKLEAVGGAVPLDSPFYIVRPTDDDFFAAIDRNDSIILVKGARQMGKTSLMARGLQEARKAGAKVVLTDFQKLNASHLESVEKLFLTLSEVIADQLDMNIVPEDFWNPRRGPSMNFERFLRREILDKLPCRLVWGMDEADRLFSFNFASEVFGLFRSWHNERALSPDGPWQKLSLAISYASEAHMFITDMNQSPFNVGTRLVLADFTREQVSELNRRYGAPLKDSGELKGFYELLSGQPYLTRRGLHELASHKMKFSDFEAQAAKDDGPFGDHLRRILVSLAQDPVLCEIVRGMLAGKHTSTTDSFYRLRSSGIVAGDSARDMKPRCRLYQIYLTRHL
jgi:serine/threonine protein kinase/class 3 adenylate cyclase